MDDKEYRACLKRHGYHSSDESDSDSKMVLDEIYEQFKPPPIQIDPDIHQIIEITSTDTIPDKCDTSANMSYASALKKNSQIDVTQTSEKIILSKSQRKKMKKKLAQKSSDAASNNPEVLETIDFAASCPDKINNTVDMSHKDILKTSFHTDTLVADGTPQTGRTILSKNQRRKMNKQNASTVSVNFSQQQDNKCLQKLLKEEANIEECVPIVKRDESMYDSTNNAIDKAAVKMEFCDNTLDCDNTVNTQSVEVELKNGKQIQEGASNPFMLVFEKVKRIVIRDHDENFNVQTSEIISEEQEKKVEAQIYENDGEAISVNSPSVINVTEVGPSIGTLKKTKRKKKKDKGKKLPSINTDVEEFCQSLNCSVDYYYYYFAYDDQNFANFISFKERFLNGVLDESSEKDQMDVSPYDRVDAKVEKSKETKQKEETPNKLNNIMPNLGKDENGEPIKSVSEEQEKKVEAQIYENDGEAISVNSPNVINVTEVGPSIGTLKKKTRRRWKKVNGKKVPPINTDVEEFCQSLNCSVDYYYYYFAYDDQNFANFISFKERFLNGVLDESSEKDQTDKSQNVQSVSSHKDKTDNSYEKLVAIIDTFQTKDLCEDILKIFEDLRCFIEINLLDASRIYEEIQIFQEELDKLGLPFFNCFRCVCVLMVKVALSYENFMTYSEQLAMNSKEYLDYIDVIVLEILWDKSYMSDFSEVTYGIYNYTYALFNTTLVWFVEKIVTSVTNPNEKITMIFYNHVVDKKQLHRSFGICYLEWVRRAIRRKKKGVNFNDPRYIFLTTKHVPDPDQQVFENKSSFEFIPLKIENGEENLYDRNSLESNFENCQISQNRSTKTEVLNLQKVVHTDSNADLSPQRLDQTLLQSLVIEDLTENRRYFYDGSVFENNTESWQNFQTFYLNCSLNNVNEEFSEEVSHSQLQRHVVEDLTRESKYFFDSYCDEPCFGEWKHFQRGYLNNGTSKFLCDEKIQKADNQALDVSENSSVEYPLLWIQNSCDIKTIISLFLFLVFKKQILWFLYNLFVIVNYVDVVFLILLLVYFCTCFIIKL